MSKFFKAVLLSSLSVVAVSVNNVNADELTEMIDGSPVAKKSVEHNASIVVGPYPTNLGAELKTTEKLELSGKEGDQEVITESELSIKPVLVTDQSGMAIFGKVMINPFGTTTKKTFGDPDDSVKPFFMEKTLPLSIQVKGLKGHGHLLYLSRSMG